MFFFTLNSSREMASKVSLGIDWLITVHVLLVQRFRSLNTTFAS